MPWHCALGAHERYLLEVVRRLPRLSDELSRSVITFAFSGSRDIELFETLLRPLFEQHASEEDATLGQLLLQKPFEALRRGGDLCRRYEAYRLRGKKLHTTCYQCHPPAGAAGSGGDDAATAGGGARGASLAVALRAAAACVPAGGTQSFLCTGLCCLWHSLEQ